jgi:hypothetical protein
MSKSMAKLMTTEVDFLTGEEITRELTDAEIAQLEVDRAESDARALEAAVKADAKAALLERLGITAEEAKLLLA